jgi:hypothetical protein
MLSPLLSNRFIRIDFRARSLSFLEVKHEGVTESNLRQRWADHLTAQGLGDDVERVVRQLEDHCVVNAPQGLSEAVQVARSEGRNPYLQVRELLESARTVQVPRDWLTALKRAPWPNSEVCKTRLFTFFLTFVRLARRHLQIMRRWKRSNKAGFPHSMPRWFLCSSALRSTHFHPSMSASVFLRSFTAGSSASEGTA